MAGLCFWKRQASLSPARWTQVRPGLRGPGGGVFFSLWCDWCHVEEATGPVCPVTARQGGEAGELRGVAVTVALAVAGGPSDYWVDLGGWRGHWAH